MNPYSHRVHDHRYGFIRVQDPPPPSLGRVGTLKPVSTSLSGFGELSSYPLLLDNGWSSARTCGKKTIRAWPKVAAPALILIRPPREPSSTPRGSGSGGRGAVRGGSRERGSGSVRKRSVRRAKLLAAPYLSDQLRSSPSIPGSESLNEHRIR